MYGQYTKDLSDFARIQAARVKLTERRLAKKPQQKLTPLHRLKGNLLPLAHTETDTHTGTCKNTLKCSCSEDRQVLSGSRTFRAEEWRLDLVIYN